MGEALRSIGYDQPEFLRKKVKLYFDSVGQAPASFSAAGKTDAIDKVSGRFKTRGCNIS